MTFILTAGGGGGKGSSKIPPTTAPCKTKIVQLSLSPISNTQMMADGRNPAYPGFQPNPNIFSGASNAIATSYDDKTKNYCVVTISSVKCKDYGTKTYVYKPLAGFSFINVEIPNDTFVITVNLYEKCGPYYSGTPSNFRGNWIHQQTYNPPIGNIVIANWLYNSKQFC